MSMSSVPLNAEPSNPQIRKENRLPPKSYASAVAESAPQTDGLNGELSEHRTELPGSDERKQIYEKHISADGVMITSVKPTEYFEESLRHSRATAPGEPTNGEKKQDSGSTLASGRPAGKGWERSV